MNTGPIILIATGIIILGLGMSLGFDLQETRYARTVARLNAIEAQLEKTNETNP